METFFQAFEALGQLPNRLNDSVAAAIQELLEHKHLYQSVSVDPNQVVSELASHVYGDDRQRFAAEARRIVNESRFSPSSSRLYAAERSGGQTPIPVLLLRNVKIFCKMCDGSETAAPMWYTEMTNELNKSRLLAHPGSDWSVPVGYQLFLLAYKCLRCDSTPTTFLIRRDGWRFYLDGRSPMEQLLVPPFLPKQEQQYFRDALIASHGGKTLAALFYLRVFIEQFARRQTGISGKVTGEMIMSKYGEQLPLEHRDRMPSLKHWYDQLSGALHEAREDADLLERARQEIEHHFDIRRVFKIADASNAKP